MGPRGTASDRRFESLWREHEREVHAYLLRRVEPTIAADLLADTFLVAWRRLDKVPADPFPWLLGVARRLLSNHWRSDRRARALITRLGQRTPSHVPEPELPEDPRLAVALRTLTPAEREIVLLVAWEGLQIQQAALALNCSPSAASVRLHRARQKLGAALERTPAPRRMSAAISEVQND